jgi:TrmH family RNA methyltransferase
MGAIFSVALAHASDVGELPGERVALVADAPDVLRAAAFSAAPREGAAGAPADASADGLTLLVGSERYGLPDELVAACERSARIPIASDSLNAAMAATVALYELTRDGRPAPASSRVRA